MTNEELLIRFKPLAKEYQRARAALEEALAEAKEHGPNFSKDLLRKLKRCKNDELDAVYALLELATEVPDVQPEEG